MAKVMKMLYGQNLALSTAIVTDGRFSGTNNGCFVGLTRYFEPEYFLENYLKIKIRQFNILDDDVFLTKNVIIWGTSVFEACSAWVYYRPAVTRRYFISL